jgi:molybdate transport system substrate-binding protein
MKRLLRAWCVLSAAALAAATGSARDLLVFGAASLTESLQEAGKQFEAQGGAKVAFSFASSSDLARQIQAGAPADVFFSADTLKMDAVEKAGLVRKADRREFLSNALVFVVPSDSNATVASAKDLERFSRIALADPKAVPVGVYAKRWLSGKGLWSAVEPKIIPTLDVRASLAAVAGGDVPVGIVYSTDAATSRDVRAVYTVEDGPPILYSVAPIATSKNAAEASKFVAFLDSPTGRAIFEQRGFLVRSNPPIP